MTTEKRQLANALALISAFQAINRDMPIQVAATFATVALYEGRSLREYCDILGAAQSMMSRHLLDLGERNRFLEPGYRLVEYRTDPQDLRRNVYTVTPRGKRLVERVAKALEN